MMEFHHSIRLNKKMVVKSTVILSEAWALRAGGQEIVEISIHLIINVYRHCVVDDFNLQISAVVTDTLACLMAV
jgi:hypothetical protein